MVGAVSHGRRRATVCDPGIDLGTGRDARRSASRCPVEAIRGCMIWYAVDESLRIVGELALRRGGLVEFLQERVLPFRFPHGNLLVTREHGHTKAWRRTDGSSTVRTDRRKSPPEP